MFQKAKICKLNGFWRKKFKFAQLGQFFCSSRAKKIGGKVCEQIQRQACYYYYHYAGWQLSKSRLSLAGWPADHHNSIVSVRWMEREGLPIDAHRIFLLMPATLLLLQRPLSPSIKAKLGEWNIFFGTCTSTFVVGEVGNRSWKFFIEEK